MSVNKFQPARLRLARLFHGLSQPELGERIGSSRQYIHQLEAGVKTPNELMLNVLCEQLEVVSDFFFHNLVDDVAVEQCHFRKQRTTPICVTQQALARGSLFGSLVNELDFYLNLPEVNFPEISISTSNEIERAAETCRMHWGLGINTPIVNITRVAENAGAVITHFEGVSEKVDALSVSRKRPLIVMSTKKGSACRSRFDIAHEIGHLVMHQGIETGDHETEAQANQFASAFLLPRTALAAEFPRGSQINWAEIYRIKLKYKVSVAAILYRAHHDLKLLDASQYRRAQIHLSKTGQRKIENFDDEIIAEEPELLHMALKLLSESENITSHFLAKSLNMKDSFFSKLTGIEVVREKSEISYKFDNVINFSDFSSK